MLDTPELRAPPIVGRLAAPRHGRRQRRWFRSMRQLATDRPAAVTGTVAALVAAVHYVALSSYTVDDAAISYAYASAIAEGLPPGIVTPGEPIAEGYSNPTWTAMLALAAVAGVSPEAAATVLGGVLCVVGAVLATLLISRLVNHRSLVYVGVLAGCSVTWVLWAASGLENALFGVLVLGATMALTSVLDHRRIGASLATGGLLALVVVSRPEGFVYLLTGVLVLLLAPGSSMRSRALTTIAVSATTAVLVGPYLLWHHAHFGVLMANPVYAKGASSFSDTVTSALDVHGHGWRYVTGFLTDHRWMLAVPAVAAAIVRWRTPASAVIVMTATTILLPVLEPDWMPGYRFTSTTALLLVVVAAVGLDVARDVRVLRGSAFAAVATLLAVVAVGNLGLGLRIASSGLPGAVTVESVELRSDRMATFAATFGLGDPLVMLPDIGAALDRTDLRILDSAGLADMQIAHSWADFGARWRYAFDERRPALVHTHGSWSGAWTIDEAADVEAAGYSTLAWTDDNLDGDFVRTDTLLADDLAFTVPLVVAVTPVIDGEVLVDAYWTGAPAASTQRTQLLAGNTVLAESSLPLGYGIVEPGALRSGETLRQHARLVIPEGSIQGPYRVAVRAGNREIDVAVPTSTTPAPSPRVGRALEAFPDAAVSQILRPPSTGEADLDRALSSRDCTSIRSAADLVARDRGRARPTAEHRALAVRALDGHDLWTVNYECLLAASILDPERPDVLLVLVDRRGSMD